jgi:hypothetical protein
VHFIARRKKNKPIFVFFQFPGFGISNGKCTRRPSKRARDGIAPHGALPAYIRDFRASSELFEIVTAERRTAQPHEKNGKSAQQQKKKEKKSSIFGEHPRP